MQETIDREASRIKDVRMRVINFREYFSNNGHSGRYSDDELRSMTGNYALLMISITNPREQFEDFDFQ